MRKEERLYIYKKYIQTGVFHVIMNPRNTYDNWNEKWQKKI